MSKHKEPPHPEFGGDPADATLPPSKPRSNVPDNDATIPPAPRSGDSSRTEIMSHAHEDSIANLNDSTIPPADKGRKQTSQHVESQTIGMSAGEAAQLEGTGRYFGEYLLIKEIARGGMGVVYQAQQIKLKRLVALKMIVAGELATAAAVDRFHIEAEAAAQLDHPGIVPIFEVGEIGGQHFFSMGFVEGGSLAGKLADGPLAPRDAALFLRKIADAVSYAHEKGVVHRDLKPANILLDRSSEPKITDFGLAKQIKDGEAGSSATTSGEILGTPSYMPPEQAAGKIQDIGPISDVYSLGAILYALITGRPPFQAASVMDTLIQVLERDPVSPRQLNASVPRDLETICLKSLQKDRHRRYQSASELRDELDRFLANEPIHARPIGRMQRAVRWCKRKPALASLIFALILLAMGSFAAIFSQWRRAEQNYQQAESLRTVAENRLRETQEIVDKYFTEVSENVLLNKPGMTQLRQQLFARALEYYQRFVDEEKDNPKLQLELAKAFLRLGAINSKLARPDIQPEELYQKAATLLEERLKVEPENTKILQNLAVANNSIAVTCIIADKYDRALSLYEKSLGYVQRAEAIDSSDIQSISLEASIIGGMGNIHRIRGQNELAAQKLKKCAAIREELLNRSLDSATTEKYRAQLALAYSNLAIVLSTPEEILNVMQKAVAIQKSLHEAAPEDVDKAYQLDNFYYNLGVLLDDMKRHDEGIEYIKKSIAIAYKLINDHPTMVEYRFHIVRNSTVIYHILCDQNKKREAIPYLETALQTADRMRELQPNVVEHYTATANRYRLLGETQLELGQEEKSRKSFEKAYELNQAGIKIKPAVGNGYRMRVVYSIRLATYWQKHGDTARVAAYTHDAIEAMEAFSKQDGLELLHIETAYMIVDELVEFLCKQAKYHEAWLALRKGAPLLEKGSIRFKHGKLSAETARLYAQAAGFDASKDPALAKDVAAKKEELCGSAIRCLKFALANGYNELDAFQKYPAAAVLKPRKDYQELFKAKPAPNADPPRTVR